MVCKVSAGLVGRKGGVLDAAECHFSHTAALSHFINQTVMLWHLSSVEQTKQPSSHIHSPLIVPALPAASLRQTTAFTHYSGTVKAPPWCLSGSVPVLQWILEVRRTCMPDRGPDSSPVLSTTATRALRTYHSVSWLGRLSVAFLEIGNLNTQQTYIANTLAQCLGIDTPHFVFSDYGEVSYIRLVFNVVLIIIRVFWGMPCLQSSIWKQHVVVRG